MAPGASNLSRIQAHVLPGVVLSARSVFPRAERATPQRQNDPGFHRGRPAFSFPKSKLVRPLPQSVAVPSQGRGQVWGLEGRFAFAARRSIQVCLLADQDASLVKIDVYYPAHRVFSHSSPPQVERLLVFQQ